MRWSERARSWLFEIAAPAWLARGWDAQRGGFYETLTLDGAPVADAPRRLRTQARQIYVFSQAGVLGWREGLDRAQAGAAWLVDCAWREGQGWAKTLDAEGGVLDPTPDLYDHAFTAFAFAWLHRATGSTAALDLALKTFEIVENRFAHPSGQGFAHALPFAPPRLQNPHMHLFEARLAAFEATADPAHRRAGDVLAALCASRFHDPGSGALTEVFADDWSRLPGEAGRLVEPGHCFEWSWLLDAHVRAGGAATAGVSAALYRFGCDHGIDARTGLTYAAVDLAGPVIDAASRTWMQTEALKAHLAAVERGDQNARPRIDAAAEALFERHLTGAFPGGWIDRFDADGRAASDTVPASTFYHVILALAELMRVGA